MELKARDVLVALKLSVFPSSARPTYAAMAAELGMSASDVHASVKRAKAARLVLDIDGRLCADRRALLEFCVHGAKYAFPAVHGGPARGIPTAHAAPPLSERLTASPDPPPVWPAPRGGVRGFTFEPLAPSAPHAANRDPRLYELLALVDAIRGGGARERQIAASLLAGRLG